MTRRLVQECLEAPECRKFDLGTLLSTPMQRITRYPLLLKALLRHTPDSHPDYEHVSKAVSLLDSIVKLIEMRTRKTQDIQRLVEVYAKLDYTSPALGEECQLLTGPDRTILREGILKMQRSGKKAVDTHVFLFNDYLLLTVPTKGRYVVCARPIPLSMLMLRKLAAPERKVRSNSHEGTVGPRGASACGRASAPGVAACLPVLPMVV